MVPRRIHTTPPARSRCCDTAWYFSPTCRELGRASCQLKTTQGGLASTDFWWCHQAEGFLRFLAWEVAPICVTTDQSSSQMLIGRWFSVMNKTLKERCLHSKEYFNSDWVLPCRSRHRTRRHDTKVTRFTVGSRCVRNQQRRFVVGLRCEPTSRAVACCAWSFAHGGTRKPLHAFKSARVCFSLVIAPQAWGGGSLERAPANKTRLFHIRIVNERCRGRMGMPQPDRGTTRRSSFYCCHCSVCRVVKT